VTRERACALADVPEGTAHQVVVDGHPIAVVRCGGDVYAVGDICSHQRISLSEGEVMCDTKQIECWKHGSAFDLVTGEPHALPATKPVPVFPVTVEGDDVYVEVP
jgi:3-phenylpropionate/trans-cinnamate dioxygenase ferredoxin component